MASAKQILSYERELKEAGSTEKRAEIHARKLADIIESTLVTKTHFDHKLSEFDHKLSDVEYKLNTNVDKKCNELKILIIDTKAEMYKFFVGAMGLMMAVSGIMQTIFHYWK